MWQPSEKENWKISSFSLRALLRRVEKWDTKTKNVCIGASEDIFFALSFFLLTLARNSYDSNNKVNKKLEKLKKTFRKYNIALVRVESEREICNLCNFMLPFLFLLCEPPHMWEIRRCLRVRVRLWWGRNRKQTTFSFHAQMNSTPTFGCVYEIQCETGTHKNLSRNYYFDKIVGKLKKKKLRRSLGVWWWEFGLGEVLKFL